MKYHNSKMSRSTYWKASNDAERKKLMPKETDWKLPGLSPSSAPRSRTRKNGHGRPDLNMARRRFEEMSLSDEEFSDSDAEWSCSDDDSDSQQAKEDEKLLRKEREKPPATRVIVEAEALTDLFEANCVCKICSGSVTLQVNTLCLATSLVITCNNSKGCGHVVHGVQPAGTTVHERSLDNFERSTDYAANVLYVLAFLWMGDGCSEAARLLELLGLPNDTTMESRSFTIIEDRIGPVIRSLTRDILEENLIEEARLTMESCELQDQHDFGIWKSSLKADFVGPLSQAKYPQITVSFDMGWQQRSSGHNYNSPSGHALMVGALTRKPLALCVKSKLCNACRFYKKKYPELDDDDIMQTHECWKTHSGSSKSMEADACLQMTVDLFDKKNVIVKAVVIDDDSSTKARVRWSNADWMLNNNTTRAPRIMITKGDKKGKSQPRPNKGKLPRHIPEPCWLHDPNHRKRVLTGELHKLMKAGVAKRFTISKMDIIRISKNYGYMVRALNVSMTEDEMLKAGNAVLEHHFDNHDDCSNKWCRRKQETPEQRLASRRYYRCKTNDAKLYEALGNLLSRFLTYDNLKEVAHGLDTQMNESFNNAASWLAPKNKVYCGSGSLTNRISIALGTNALGNEAYFARLYAALGITMTPNIVHCFKVKSNSRGRKLDQVQTKDFKINRRKRKNDMLAQEERKATME
jgi:hypothetical protein